MIVSSEGDSLDREWQESLGVMGAGGSLAVVAQRSVKMYLVYQKTSYLFLFTLLLCSNVAKQKEHIWKSTLCDVTHKALIP